MLRRGRWSIPALLALVLCLAPGRASAELPSTRIGPAVSQNAYVGCCTDPDVVDFGVDIDLSAYYEGDTITTQYRPLGVMFGTAASPGAATMLVRLDYSRYPGCRKVLTGGSPTDFSGWEFLIFVDPSEDRWAAVQKVGADVGYCDQLHSCFLAAYDSSGNMLDVKFNDRVGFQFLSIERPAADINSVLVGDCSGGGSVCYPDPAGSALTCLSFSPPVAGGAPLPPSIPVPAPPIIVRTPGMTPLGALVAALVLAAAAVWVMRRRGRSAA